VTSALKPNLQPTDRIHIGRINMDSDDYILFAHDPRTYYPAYKTAQIIGMRED